MLCEVQLFVRMINAKRMLWCCDVVSKHKIKLEDAVAMAVDCLAGYLYTAKMDNEKIPKASKLSDINIDRLSDELGITGAYTDAFTNMVSVDVKAYAKEHFDKSVRKTLTIPAWLNTAAQEEGINFSKTLQEALMSKLKAH